jgi:phosphomannomutase / phosphoglucomutase
VDDLEKKIPNIIKKPVAQAVPTSVASRAAIRQQEQAKLKAAAQQRMLFILLGAALVLNIFLGYGLYEYLVKKVTHDNLQLKIETELNDRMHTASTFLTENQQKLDELAHNPAVIQALNEKNQNAMRVLEKSFAILFPEPLAINLFIAGEASTHLESDVPIRFAELDLIRRAERRDNSQVEAAQINGQWQIHFVSAVAQNNDQPVLGTLMLTLTTNALIKGFASADKNLGESVLQQKFKNSIEQHLLKNGLGSRNLTEIKSQELEVPNSHWKIKFTPSDNLLELSTESPAFWGAIVGGCTALSLFLALVLSRFLVRNAKLAEQQLAPTVADVNKIARGTITDANGVVSQQDILDIKVIDEDENILGLNALNEKKETAAPVVIDENKVPAAIFRSYDIRGIVGIDLTVELAELMGQAVGSEALDQGEQHLIVARDARTHSPELTRALVKGILNSGCNVINIGVVPTPVMYFATYHFEDTRSGIMVTASHNPAEYNGFKVVINNQALADNAVMELRTRILTQRVHQGAGEEITREIIPHYIERIFSDVALAGNVSLVIDAGNAVTGIVAPQLFEELGCEVTPLFCELDGKFPNHEPDPTQEKNLHALIAKVKEVNADLGVAFDGDGDRLVVVTPKGDIIWPDRLLMLFAKDILARNPGADVLFDVKCSRQLNHVISGYGGRPIMWKTGHSPMKAKMVETGALIGGEYSGHIFIKDRWYGFDDGIYAMARLLEIITLRDQKIDDIFASFPQQFTTPEIKVAIPDAKKFALIKNLTAQGDFQNGDITLIDGVRVDYSKGWGLVRASNTSPALTLRFEAESEEALESIKQIFKRELLKIDSNLVLHF